MSQKAKEFYQSLNADTWCGYKWCRRLYCNEITYRGEGLLDRVFARLDELGRGDVKHIYALYEKLQIAHEREVNRLAGKWLSEQINKEYERKVKEAEWQKKKIRYASSQALNAVLGWK